MRQILAPNFHMLIGIPLIWFVCQAFWVRLCANVDVRRCVFTGFLLYKYICGWWRLWWWCLMMVAFNHMFAVLISLSCMCRETLHRFHAAKQFPYSRFSLFRDVKCKCVCCLWYIWLVGWQCMRFFTIFLLDLFLIFHSTFPFLRCVKVWVCICECECVYVYFSLFFFLNFYAFSMQF